MTLKLVVWGFPHLYFRKTFEITDYDQYYADIEAGNEANELTWSLEYSFLDYYGVDNLSAATYDALSDGLMYNDTIWDKFFQVWFVGRTYSACNDACRMREACATKETDLEAYFECMGYI